MWSFCFILLWKLKAKKLCIIFCRCIYLQMRRKCLIILLFYECKTYFHRRNCVPSAECALKCRETHQSSEQLFITFVSVCITHTGTLQKGQESLTGGARWAHCRDLLAGGNHSSEGNLCAWSAVWENESEYWVWHSYRTRTDLKMWISGTLKLILRVTVAPGDGWHTLWDAVIQGSFWISVTQERKQCKKLLCWYK